MHEDSYFPERNGGRIKRGQVCSFESFSRTIKMCPTEVLNRAQI